MEVLMATTNTKPEPKARTFGENIESDLASRFLRVVETAAIASARTMGKGDRRLADDVATQAMRRTMDNVPMRGTIVIGEGERDEAPMLYIGEKVGAEFPDGTEVPDVDIAVDPLEGTNLCATGAPGAITVLAASERNGLLNAPDCYMEKIVVGPSRKNEVELDAPVADNLTNIAHLMARDVAHGKQLIFAATGVTDGSLMRGVRFFGEGIRTSSVILTLRTGKVRFIDSIHLEKGPDVKVRFA